MIADQKDHLMTVLIADASRSNRVMLRRHLERLGYFCLTVENGTQTLSMLRETNVSVLLMDMKFPDIDGFHLVRTIMRQPAMYRPVIIAVTACTMPGDKQLCRDCGCDGYIPKPVSLPMLISTMDHLLDADDRKRCIA